MGDPPFDLSKFDPSTLDLSHLDRREQNRIRAGQYDNRELSLLLQKKNPWTRSGKPEPLRPNLPKAIDPRPPTETPKPARESSSENKKAERRLEFFTDPKTGKTQMVLRTGDEPTAKPSHAQTTGQKIRKLCEAVFGVVAVIFGTQITSSVVSLVVLMFGWGLLTALIWELNLFNAKTRTSRAAIGAILTVILGGVLYVAYRVSRPAPSAPPLTRTELHEELQGS